MPSVKIKIRPPETAGNPATICYLISHNRKTCVINTAYHADRDMPDTLVRQDICRLSRIIRRMNDSLLPFSVRDIADEYHRQKNEYSISPFMLALIEKLKSNGQTRTAETYTLTLRSFTTFISRHYPGVLPKERYNIMIDSITADLMEAYESWLKRRGLTRNSTSFYIRILRAVYNRAVRMNITEDMHPFRNVYTGVDKTVKRSLSLNQLRIIKNMDLSAYPALDHARDIFMLSFYLRGMSFIDMAFLRQSDLRNGLITYCRRKTGRLLAIQWTAEMQAIIDKYPYDPAGYLLPILQGATSETSSYKNRGYAINSHLKKIAMMAGINTPLTLYVARHTWASIARDKGIPISVISEGMGHDSEATTRIYLASLDASLVNKANALIISSI